VYFIIFISMIIMIAVCHPSDLELPMGKLFEILDKLRSATKDGGFFDFDDLPAFSGAEGEGGLSETSRSLG
jgi:hypothetical protein